MPIREFGAMRPKPKCDYQLTKWIFGEENIRSAIEPLEEHERWFKVKKSRNGRFAVFVPKCDVETTEPPRAADYTVQVTAWCNHMACYDAEKNLAEISVPFRIAMFARDQGHHPLYALFVMPRHMARVEEAAVAGVRSLAWFLAKCGAAQRDNAITEASAPKSVRS